jgi:pimeloyl-ACP methyl ester carboxylesterase
VKETLILIPGFGNDARAWKHQIDHLSSFFEIRTKVMDKYATRHDMIKALLDEAPEKFILAGHSMGGWAAQAIASAAPQRVLKLILLNTWATADPKMIYLQRHVSQMLKEGRLMEAMQSYIGLLVHPSRMQDLTLIQTLQSMITSFPVNVLIQQLEAMLEDYSSLHLHHSISAPTLVVHSHDDAFFPVKELQVIATGIPNSQLTILPDTGHASTLEKPELVTSLLSAFVQEKT